MLSHRTHRHLTNRLRRAKERREGAVLLIVLLILLMATSTATFAMQSTAFEIRAAGSMRNALRTKYVAESFVMAGVSYLQQTNGVTTALTTGGFDQMLRNRYALPQATGETTYSMTPNDLSGTTFPCMVVPSDNDFAGGGAASPFTPSFNVQLEQWGPLPAAAATSTDHFRWVASSYGELNVATDCQAPGEQRSQHTSVSISRAYYDVR